MKRMVYIVVFVLFIITLCSCGQKTKQLENMSTLDTDKYVAIVWGDKTYVPFCAISNSERGKKIGIVNSDENDQVYEYKGYSTDKWVISFYNSGEMDSSMLMRELNVKDIPKGLKSEYEWNSQG